MARRQLKNGDVAGGRKRLDEYLEAGDRSNVRYSGDYPLYLRKQAIRTIAAEYARAGLWNDLLKSLGDFLDAPSSREYGNDPAMGDLLAMLAGQLASRPARERYEILKEWTMPTPKRRMVRILAAAGPDDPPPPAFLKRDPAAAGAPASPDRGKAHDEVFSTATALIDSAREAGTLDTLADAARAAAGEKVENAQALHLLVEMSRGRGESIRPQLEARLQELIKDAEAQPEPSGCTPDRPSAPASPGPSRGPTTCWPGPPWIGARPRLATWGCGCSRRS